tara:strand:- start:341 stop:568 length:228 start_codon:yes stop_codon:yes gene_type:complete
MDKFFEGAMIAIIFVIGKVLELKFVKKDDIVMKLIIREAIVVYLAAIGGLYLSDMFGDNLSKVDAPSAYVGDPGF